MGSMWKTWSGTGEEGKGLMGGALDANRYRVGIAEGVRNAE